MEFTGVNIFLTFTLKIECEYPLDLEQPPHRGGSNVNQQSLF